MVDITRGTGRAKLPPRREPYWTRSGNAYLGFRCTGGNGDGTWVGRIREDGRQHYQALGRFDDYRDAEKALRAWLERRLADSAAGVDHRAVRELTVADACRAYLDNVLKTKGPGRPYNLPLNILEAKVLGRAVTKRKIAKDTSFIANVKLVDLHQRHIKQWKSSLLPCDEANATRSQRATAARHFKTLIAALNHAHLELLISSDAAWKTVKNFNDVQARADESHRYLTKTERQSLITACRTELKEFVKLLALTGARPIELQRLTAKDYNIATQEISLWSYKGNKRERRIRRIPALSLPGVLPIVQRLVEGKLPSAFLFEQKQEFWLSPLKAAVRSAGLPDDVSAYSLRHSFITDAVGAGVPLATLAAVTGTSALQIERTYGKLLSTHVEQAFAKMGGPNDV